MDKNKGLLALKLNKAMGKKGVSQGDIAKAVDLSQATVSCALRGRDDVSLKSYGKIAEYLGVPMKDHDSLIVKRGLVKSELSGDYVGVYAGKVKPEKSLVSYTDIQNATINAVSEGNGYARTMRKIYPLVKDYVEQYPKKLTKEDIVQAERETMQQFKVSYKAGANENMTCKLEQSTDGETWQEVPMKTTVLPAPVVQNEFTRWQAWVIMALQVVVILFLIFPVK